MLTISSISPSSSSMNSTLTSSISSSLSAIVWTLFDTWNPSESSMVSSLLSGLLGDPLGKSRVKDSTLFCFLASLIKMPAIFPKSPFLSLWGYNMIHMKVWNGTHFSIETFLYPNSKYCFLLARVSYSQKSVASEVSQQAERRENSSCRRPFSLQIRTLESRKWRTSWLINSSHDRSELAPGWRGARRLADREKWSAVRRRRRRGKFRGAVLSRARGRRRLSRSKKG